MIASKYGHKDIVELLHEKEGIDEKAKDINLFLSNFTSFIWCFKIIFGN